MQNKNLAYILIGMLVVVVIGVAIYSGSGTQLQGNIGLQAVTPINNAQIPQDTTKRLEQLEKRVNAAESKLNCMNDIYYANFGNNPNLVQMNNFINGVKNCLMVK